MKFTRQDTPTVMDGLVVRYKNGEFQGDLEISASRNGVMISGYSRAIKSKKDLMEFSMCMTKAYRQYERISSRNIAFTEDELDSMVFVP